MDDCLSIEDIAKIREKFPNIIPPPLNVIDDTSGLIINETVEFNQGFYQN